MCVCVAHYIQPQNGPERGSGERERVTERDRYRARERQREIEKEKEQLIHSKKVRGDSFFKLACCYNSEA